MVAIGEKSGDLFIWGEGVRLKTHLLGLFLFGENKTQQTKQNISHQPPYVKKINKHMLTTNQKAVDRFNELQNVSLKKSFHLFKPVSTFLCRLPPTRLRFGTLFLC